MKFDMIFSDVLRSISPSVKEVKDLVALSDDIISKLSKAGISAALGGSLAKGTIVVKDVQDIDIFLLFEKESEIETLEKVLSGISFGGELKRVHGSRDYFQLQFEDVIVELIPTIVVDSPEDALNVTDVSVFHVKYITRMISKSPKIADEIRLAKAFCRAQGVYGAESYVKGFSGYSLEVLVIYFGGFLNFLKKVSRKRVIDPSSYFKSEKDVLYSLNEAKTQSPLIVVDPTYRYRNVTAGLSDDTYGRFLEISKKFMKRPDSSYFESQPFDVTVFDKLAKKKKGVVVSFDIMTNRQSGDIAGTKCRKFFDFFIAELKRYDQKVIDSHFIYDGSGSNATGYLVVVFNSEIELRGPPVAMKDAATQFEKVHKDAYSRRGTLYVKKDVSLEDIFLDANRVKDEMGAWGEHLKYDK